MEEKKIKTEELEQGKIYYLDYGSNTQIIGRYKDSDVCQHNFYDLIHYWNGFETFRSNNQYCVLSGIENLRRATKAEKHSLIKFEIEHDCI